MFLKNSVNWILTPGIQKWSFVDNIKEVPIDFKF